jgi:uncharacterized protein (TIGR00156 family)
MRKSFLSVIAIAFASVAATGCVTHEDKPITTAQQARGASDDRAVQINGTIVRQRSGDHYIVNDGTSDILVEIKDHVRLGKRLDPGMKVQINGEIEGRTLRDSKVEARSVTVLP